MVSLTLSISEDFKKLLQHFSWVNWSEVAREETTKKLIFENYLKTGTIRDEEWMFCEEKDWHPVDELPLKKEFLAELHKRRAEKPIRIKSIKDVFKE